MIYTTTHQYRLFYEVPRKERHLPAFSSQSLTGEITGTIPVASLPLIEGNIQQEAWDEILRKDVNVTTVHALSKKRSEHPDNGRDR
jgi:hypothetical protein